MLHATIIYVIIKLYHNVNKKQKEKPLISLKKKLCQAIIFIILAVCVLSQPITQDNEQKTYLPLIELLNQRPVTALHLDALKKLENLPAYPPIWPAIMPLANEPQEQIRHRVVMLWGTWKIKAPQEWIVARLADPSLTVQSATLWALGEMRDGTWISILCQVANNNAEPWQKRCAAINALSRFSGNPEIYATLSANLEAQHPYIRVNAVRAIQQFPLLVEQTQGKILAQLHGQALNSQENAVVRTTICDVLGQWGYTDSIPVLAEIWLQEESCPSQQRQHKLLAIVDAALTRLALLHPQRFCDMTLDTRIHPTLRKNYVLMLTRNKEKFNTQELETCVMTANVLLANRNENENIRGVALMLFTEIRQAAALPQLYISLHDPQDTVREFAILGLGYLRDQQKLPEFLALLNAPNPRIREAAVWAIARLPLSITREHILQMLQPTNSDNTIITGIRFVFELKIQEAAPLLLKLGEHDRWSKPCAGALEQLLTVLPPNDPSRPNIERFIQVQKEKFEQEK